MLGPDAVDDLLAVARRSVGRQRQASRPLAISNQTPPLPTTRPFRKFIAGEPMKPATNRLRGLS